ncbi:aminoacyl-tRNA hydrolase [Candidatus Woesebacteria bacterium]|nr:aminoacyl-tRNA hydrolase [Candidatus Woesebacteria bacterium]
MILIAGLGNPGKKYRNNRHNVGFHCIDFFAAHVEKGLHESINEEKLFEQKKQFSALMYRTQKSEIKVAFVKPQTFMNASGNAVRKIATYFKIAPERIVVVHDDLDIKLGEYKLSFGKGPKDHNGISSIEHELGTAMFWRVRVGIDNRTTENYIPGIEYVLTDFTSHEKMQINTLLPHVWEQLQKTISF